MSSLRLLLSKLAQPLEFFLERDELVLVKFLEIHQLWPGAGRASDQLIELQLQRPGIAVLGVLQEERDEG